ncbi:amidohydrolase family protein [Actinotalea ferrariae]|uniref:amidohydrolase n=1 Tax=Actinotalea ferrariae TaxID=1386098 RepID=UPI001C8CF04E|nr:amidohydrolase family protein [Actinotalea ferrariae]MBX9247141.1 amidohydrolase family protein [Actinotalea ferrariae]
MTAATRSGAALLLRRARVVDVPPGAVPAAGVPVAGPGESDVLVVDGVVRAVAPTGTAGDKGTAGVRATGDLGGRSVETVDLEGRWLAPGLWDAHTHMEQWALARQRLDVSAAASAAAAAALVRDRLRSAPPPAGTALVGVGFRDGLWGDVPTSALLDDAAASAGHPDVPVVLVSGDLHCGWLSSLAARRHGVLDAIGADGTGLLREHPWFPVLDRLGDAPGDVVDAWVADAVRAAAERGVVGVVDYEMGGAVPAWERRVAAGHAGLRVVASVWAAGLDAVVERRLRTGDALGGPGGPGTASLVTMGPLKVITDGSLNTRTAYCHDPYPGLTGPGAHGVLSVPPEQLRPLMARAVAAGLECAIHAIGDRANALALDAFEATGARGSVEHAQLLVADDVARFARLGVVASVQPEHAMDDRDVADRYWAGRTHRAFPLRALHEAGVRLVLGSDAPVAPLDPWTAIGAAVDRARDGREPWHGEQRLPADVALAVSVRTRVAPGQAADLAVLDADPLATTDEALRRMPVAGTLLAGRWTHRAL